MFEKFNIHLDTAIEDLRKLIQEINSEISTLIDSGNNTYISFIKPYMETVDRLSLFFTPISHINAVKNSEQTQAIYAEALPLITAFYTDLGQHTEIYNRFNTISEKESVSLSIAQQKLVTDALRDFRNSGVHLSDDIKSELKEINIRLSELSNTFFQNILDDTARYTLNIANPDNIKGIPENDLIPAKQEDGSYSFTLQMPSYIAYMTYGPNRELRENIYKAYNTRAPQNGPIIEEILTLRHRMATLLGYKRYADYSVSSKTADTPEAVIDFLTDLADKCKFGASKEINTLKSLAAKDGISELQSYDLMYYAEKVKKENLEIDVDRYRPYFEKDSVINGLFVFLNKLFGLSFTAVETPVWDDTVTVYEMSKNGKQLARLYMDLDARDDKRDGAWMNNWHTYHITPQNDLIKPTAYIVANFPPATATTPALLRHNDVVALFHEMGHVLQHICSQIEELSVSGINGVEWDVVEFPSQFLENFAYEKDVLSLFAKHYDTGETLPIDMIDKLKELKNFNAAMGFVRQLEFGLFDMNIHLKPMDETDVQQTLDSVRTRCAPVIPPSYVKFQHQFAHIFSGGYAAGYYSYKWAERLSADAFFMFAEQQIYDKKLSDDFFTEILVKGGSDNPMKLFHNFAGRSVNNTALTKLYGID